MMPRTWKDGVPNSPDRLALACGLYCAKESVVSVAVSVAAQDLLISDFR
jgi:hypothetical protein